MNIAKIYAILTRGGKKFVSAWECVCGSMDANMAVNLFLFFMMLRNILQGFVLNIIGCVNV